MTGLSGQYCIIATLELKLNPSVISILGFLFCVLGLFSLGAGNSICPRSQRPCRSTLEAHRGRLFKPISLILFFVQWRKSQYRQSIMFHDGSIQAVNIKRLLLAPHSRVSRQVNQSPLCLLRDVHDSGGIWRRDNTYLHLCLYVLFP
jgi:hypothetical protein